jgi:hypothetical protein
MNGKDNCRISIFNSYYSFLERYSKTHAHFNCFHVISCSVKPVISRYMSMSRTNVARAVHGGSHFRLRRVALTCLGVGFGHSGDLVVDSCGARLRGRLVAFWSSSCMWSVPLCIAAWSALFTFSSSNSLPSSRMIFPKRFLLHVCSILITWSSPSSHWPSHVSAPLPSMPLQFVQ